MMRAFAEHDRRMYVLHAFPCPQANSGRAAQCACAIMVLEGGSFLGKVFLHVRHVVHRV